jgi:hypothetical protein
MTQGEIIVGRNDTGAELHGNPAQWVESKAKRPKYSTYYLRFQRDGHDKIIKAS